MPGTCALLKLTERPATNYPMAIFGQICCTLRASWRASAPQVGKCVRSHGSAHQTLSLRAVHSFKIRESHVEKEQKVCHFRRLALRRNPLCLHRALFGCQANLFIEPRARFFSPAHNGSRKDREYEMRQPSGECPSALRAAEFSCSRSAHRRDKYLSWSRVWRARKFREVSIMVSITGSECSFCLQVPTTIRKILHIICS
jgi:hypothetical protein